MLAGLAADAEELARAAHGLDAGGLHAEAVASQTWSVRSSSVLSYAVSGAPAAGS